MRVREKWSRERVITAIRELREAGEKLNCRHVMRTQSKLYGAANRHCGSWKKAVGAAGYDYTAHSVQQWGFWTRRTVVTAILTRKRKRLPLNPTAVIATDYGLYAAAVRLFGRNGWAKAVRKAGLEPVNLGNFWTKERVCDEIRKLRCRGKPLREKHLAENGYLPLLAAAQRHWGSWRKAVEAAGYDSRRLLGRPPSSIRAWLRTLTPSAQKRLERQTLEFARTHGEATAARGSRASGRRN